MKKLLMIIAVMICVSCAEGVIDQENPVSGKINRTVVDGDLISQLKAKAVETLNIGSNSFVLDAYLWRDFMPESPPDGKPMIALNRLVDACSVKIPDNISMVKQYVINNNLVWESDYEDDAPLPSLPDYKIERVSRNGPKWETNIHVDVISEIYDSDAQKSYYIILKNVLINLTY